MATTDSATGTLVAPYDEGLKVVGAVSSEMAIPYSAKTLHGRTMVPRAAADALKRGWQDDSIVSLSKWRVRWIKRECKLCPGFTIVAAFVLFEIRRFQPTQVGVGDESAGLQSLIS